MDGTDYTRYSEVMGKTGYPMENFSRKTVPFNRTVTSVEDRGANFDDGGDSSEEEDEFDWVEVVAMSCEDPSADESVATRPHVKRKKRKNFIKESEMVGPSDSEESYSCQVEELTVASTNDDGFLPCLVPYSSSSDSDEAYVIPVVKGRRVNLMGCSASGSDQDEVSFSGCDENYIPSSSSGSDTGDCQGDEELASKASAPSLNRVKSVLDKNRSKKDRTAHQISSCSSDSDQDEEGIQRRRKSRVRYRLVKGVNNVPSSSDGSDADDCQGDKELASKSSVPSLSGVKVCMANNKGRRVWDKRHFCVYCMKAFPKLPGHLEQVHSSEKDVVEALSFSKNSPKRKRLFDLLRNKGNHAHNLEVLENKSGYIIPAKRPTFDVPASDYLPCSQCFGYYIGRDMWKHLKFCTAKELHAEMKRGERHQARCALLLPVSRVASSAFQTNILGAMIGDEIARVAQKDDMINKFGERMYSKLGQETPQYNYISQKMRELARLLLAIRATHNYEQVTLTDVLRPEHFDTILESVRTCAGFNASTCVYKTPSLPLKLGHSLKKCASIMKADAILEGDSQLKMAADNFIELCEIEWSHRVSSSALATLEERNRNKPDMLPLSEDIIKFYKYLGNISTEAKAQLPLKGAWITLAEATLTKIILFNRRRSGEAQRIKVTEFEQRHTGNISCDVHQSLTTWEQTLCNKLNRIEVKGKRGTKVPVLLTGEMTESLELLVKHRSSVGISSDNVFLFAQTNGDSQMCIRGSDCVRKLAIKSCVKVPENLTSTKLRKQIATLSQIFCLRDNELDILAGFLGHDIHVHPDYYRLPEDALQAAKVARLLMLMEKGLVADFKDKTLSEIEVALDDPSYDDVDDESGNEEDEGEEEEEDEQEEEEQEEEGEDGGEEEEDEEQKEEEEVEEGEDEGENVNGDEEEQHVERKERRSEERVEERENQRGRRKPIEWPLAEAKAIEKHFAKHIRLFKVPRKYECEECIKKNPLLANHPWKRIKYKVYSIIQRNRKY